MSKTWRLIISFVLLLHFNSESQIYPQTRIPCDSTKYVIQFHTIKTDTGINYFNNNIIVDLVRRLNITFADACIQFQLCSPDTIHDYNYWNLTDDLSTFEPSDMINMFYHDHVINLYWSDDYDEVTMNGICESPDRKPKIILTRQISYKNQITDFQKKMLDYFGMTKTSSLNSSKELVNMTNGKITADSVWDSPADPILLNLKPGEFIDWSTIFEGYYYGNLRDINGQLYNPMHSNLLSQWPMENFSQKLTNEQYKVLILKEKACRHKRWGF